MLFQRAFGMKLNMSIAVQRKFSKYKIIMFMYLFAHLKITLRMLSVLTVYIYFFGCEEPSFTNF